MVSLLMSLLAAWACAYGLQTAAKGAELKLYFYQAGSVFAGFGGIVALAVSMEASGFGHWITRRRVLSAAAVTALMMLSALTAQYHSLNRYDLSIIQSGPLLVMGFKSGPLYIVQIIYVSLIYLAAQVFFFIGAVRAKGSDRFRCFLLLIGTIVPFLVERMSITPFKGFSMTTSTLWFSGACYTLAIVRHGLLKVVPMARSTLFESLIYPAIVLDSRGRLADSNRAARELAMPCWKAGGVSMVEALQKRFPIMDSITVPSQQLHEVVADGVEEGRYWQVAITPLERRDYFLGTLIQFHDITGLKHAEEAMRLAREAAENANRVKSDFLSMVSHELRTPLQAVIGFSELAREIDDPQRIAEYLAIINDSSSSLLDMVNDILDLSRIEAGGIELDCKPFDLRNMLNSLSAIYAHRARRKGLDFSLAIGKDVPRWVTGDPLRVRQILTNIIGNAVKFTKQGKIEVDVSAHRAEELDGAKRILVCFTVRDTGIGIPEPKRGQVFESFTQADPGVTRRYGGSGLGTTIARRLARMMGGDVTFESREGEGSTFLIDITFAPSEEYHAAASVVEQDFVCRHLSVLVAEDGLFNQRLLLDTLTHRGHRVSLASDGREAVEKCRESRFDLILMDLMMPVMDGFEAARQIRASEAENGQKRAMIVAVTANKETLIRNRCMEAGMDDVISKPVTPTRLNNFLGGCFPDNVVTSCYGDTHWPARGELFDPNKLGSVMNDPERAAKYCSLLVDDLEREMNRLTESFASGDRDAISKAAHSIKGTTIPVKGSDASKLAGQLQSYAMSGSRDEMEKCHALLKTACEKLCLELKKVSRP